MLTWQEIPVWHYIVCIVYIILKTIKINDITPKTLYVSDKNLNENYNLATHKHIKVETSFQKSKLKVI